MAKDHGSFAQVALSDVRRIHGRHPALIGVSAEFCPGEVCVVMGPNGAGKSTLLNIIAALNCPSAGDVRYGRYSHRYVRRFLRHRLGLMGHALMLYPTLSARENLVFFARMYGLPDAAASADRWLDTVGLDEGRDRPLSTLSRGMAQRVALARALINRPCVLLLDEPFTGLDRSGCALLREQVYQTRDRGASVLLVTHDVEALGSLGDRLMILDKGRLVADRQLAGESSEVLWQYYQAALS